MTSLSNRVTLAATALLLITGCFFFLGTSVAKGQSFKPNKTPIRTPFIPAVDRVDFSKGYAFNYTSSADGRRVTINEWINICDSERVQPTFVADSMRVNNQSIAKQWQSLYRTIELLGKEGDTFAAKLKIVNSFFNQWPYQPDSKNWHKNDYWATPREFIINSGDCEDYAIVKYFALRALGIPAANMAVVIVDDTRNKITHAVLIVTNGSDFYTLDNGTELIYRNSAHSEYVPHYFMNEQAMWQPR